jgi:hypothetical protein
VPSEREDQRDGYRHQGDRRDDEGEDGPHPHEATDLLAASASRPVLIVPKTATSGRLGRFCPSLSSGGTPLAEAS